MAKPKLQLLLLAVFALALVPAFSAITIIDNSSSSEKLFTITSASLSGDLASGALTYSGSGEVLAGENVKVYLLGPSKDLAITGLTVNGKDVSAAFDGDANSYYFLSQTGKFTFTASVSFKTPGQQKIFVRGPVNKLTSDLVNGYVVDGTAYGVYNQYLVLQETTQSAPFTAKGAFRYTFAKVDTFLYQLTFTSPGKENLVRYTIDLPNGEIVSAVSGATDWRVSSGTLILDLSGSSAIVTVSGRFSSSLLRNPMSSQTEKSYFVIEGDAEKKLTISTSATEVDLSELPVSYTFGSARGFLADPSGTFAVDVKDLTILPSLSATVDSATYEFALTNEGSLLGQLDYQYQNTGVDYIDFDLHGSTPLYAGTGEGAVKLTSDNKLLLTLPKTSGYDSTLEVVYFKGLNSLGFLDVISLPIPETAMPISESRTSLFYPKDRILLHTFGAKEGGSELPSFKAILIFLAVSAILALLIKTDAKFAALYVVFAAGAAYFDFGAVLLLAAASLVLITRRFLPKGAAKPVVIGAAIILILALVVGGAIYLLGSLSGMSNGAYSDYTTSELKTAGAAPSPTFNSVEKVGEGSGAITVPMKQGVLPVKITLPDVGKSSTVTNELITPEKPLNLTVVLLADWVKYLFWIIAAYAGFLAGKMFLAPGAKRSKA